VAPALEQAASAGAGRGWPALVASGRRIRLRTRFTL
jgi:hypothetical protein